MRANKSTLSLIVIVFPQSTQQPALYNIYEPGFSSDPFKHYNSIC